MSLALLNGTQDFNFLEQWSKRSELATKDKITGMAQQVFSTELQYVFVLRPPVEQ